VCAPGHGDHRVALAAQGRQQHQHLVRLARVGQGQDDVGVGDHAQVAVAGLARVDVERRGAGGSQGGGDLARHVAGLAHAGGDHPAAAGQDQAAGLGEGRADAGADGRQGLRFDVEDAATAGDQAVGIGGRLGGGGHVRGPDGADSLDYGPSF
jgi:hypothetical protein